MISFLNDYNNIGHEEVLKALIDVKDDNLRGYGHDLYTKKAEDLIRKKLHADVDIHFMMSGTACNKTIISHALRPYESVISSKIGHININEAGAIEASGHKINLTTPKLGKVCIENMESIIQGHSNEHMVRPKMVYISNSTEIGTIYRKEELEKIAAFCRANNLYLFLDGARLPAALSSKDNNLTFSDIARLTDIFYIGGTKCGALFGEAVVIVNPKLKDGFRHTMKQNGGMLAKGFLLGLQFETLFTNNLIFNLARKANEAAYYFEKRLVEKQIPILYPVSTNQIFINLSNKIINNLQSKFQFEIWDKGEEDSTIRLVTSWMSKKEEIDVFINYL